MLLSVVPAMKFVPATVMAVSDDPAAIEFGVIELIAGTATVTVEAVETAPPGFLTVRLSVPAVAREAEGTVAVMEVALPAVTVNAVEPM